MRRESPERVAIAVLAKAPVQGYAKTRLIPALGAAGAAALQGRLCLRALETAQGSGLGPVTLWCAPDATHPFFGQCRSAHGVALHEQHGATLGERMLAAFEAAAPAPLLLIGTDCPALTVGHLHGCAARLRAGDDAVLLPAEDGGYVLIGLRRPLAPLFLGIEWGTGRVMAQTRSVLGTLGLRWSEPCTLWDVDEPDDLARLAATAPGLVHGATEDLPGAGPTAMDTAAP